MMTLRNTSLALCLSLSALLPACNDDEDMLATSGDGSVRDAAIDSGATGLDGGLDAATDSAVPAADAAADAK